MKILILATLSLLLASCGKKDNSSGPTGTTNNPTPLNPEICPSGYVEVSDFCVMKYEAKNVAGKPASQAALTPWTGTYATEAKALCQSLGTGYDLISNQEWLTIAHDLENVDANWTGGTVGSGCLFRGNNGQPMPWNPCGYGSGDGSIDFGDNRNERAKFQLASGYVIFDFAGNVSEWVDWTAGGDYDLAPINCSNNEVELNDIASDATCSLASSDYAQMNLSFDSNQGLGKFSGGAGGYARRGGASWSGASAGIYALSLNRGSFNNDGDNGFRCVYRPAR